MSLDFPVARPYVPRGPRPRPVRLKVDGSKIFRTIHGEPWRWRGVTAFALMDRFAKGEDIQPFLETFAALNYNLLRVFRYTPAADWHETAWEPRGTLVTLEFLRAVAEYGFYVELVLLTDDDPARIGQARWQVEDLSLANPDNLLLEVGNEPQVHKAIDTQALRADCDLSGFLYSSGEGGDTDRFFGHYVTHHSARDNVWPRRAHDLLEFWTGDGPEMPHTPRLMAAIGDEPIRPDQAGYVRADFRAYAGTCALLGGGATFHFESGKFGRVPTPQELRCAEAFAEGLNAFPDAAPLGPYNRPVENSLRTYIVDHYMVRVRPTAPMQFPISGIHSLDADGILWEW